MTLPQSMLASGRAGPALCWRATESNRPPVQNWSCRVAASMVAWTLSFGTVSHGSRALPCLWWCGRKRPSAYSALLCPTLATAWISSSNDIWDGCGGERLILTWVLATRNFYHAAVNIWITQNGLGAGDRREGWTWEDWELSTIGKLDVRFPNNL